MGDDAGIGQPRTEEALRSLLKRLGVEVKAMRARLDWTQRQAADHAGVARSTYASIENANGNPTFESVVKVAEAFGVSLPDLLRDGSPRANLSQ